MRGAEGTAAGPDPAAAAAHGKYGAPGHDIGPEGAGRAPRGRDQVAPGADSVVQRLDMIVTTQRVRPTPPRAAEQPLPRFTDGRLAAAAALTRRAPGAGLPAVFCDDAVHP